MKKFLLLLFIGLAIGTVAHSQDKIYRKNGQVVQATIIEVGTREVKYRLYKAEEGPVFVLGIDRIFKIQYENGQIEKFIKDEKDPELYIGQRTKALKVNFLSPLLGFTQVSYEKNLGVGKSYEASFAIIGAGKNAQLDYYNNAFRDTKKNQFGFGGSIGYKFNKLPDFTLGLMEFFYGSNRMTHLMQGTYVKPNLSLGNYSENRIAYKENNQFVVERQNITFGALHLDLGKQWVLGDLFLMDASWSLGYGLDNKKDSGSLVNEDVTAYNYLNFRLGRSPGLSTNFSLQIGMLLK